MQPIRFARKLERHRYIVATDQPGTIRSPVVLLVDPHPLHKVKVDILWYLQSHLLYKMGRIEGDVQMPGKAERLRVERNKPQIHARFAVYLHRIHQVILIERGPHGGKRTHKPVQKKGNIILEKIHILQHLLQELLHPLLREQLVYPRPLDAAHHPFLLLRIFAVVHILQRLLYGDIQYRLTRNIRGIHIVLQEIELLVQPLLLLLLVKVIQGKRHLLILLVPVVVFVSGIILLFGINHLLYKGHGRIALLNITLLAGFDNHLIEGIGSRRHRNLQVVFASRFQGNQLLVVPQIRKYKHSGTRRACQSKVTIGIGGGSLVSTLKQHRNEGKSLARNRIEHHPLHRSLSHPPCRNQLHQKQQRYVAYIFCWHLLK